jgi:FAD/FMN-containing dehydrogenase
MLSWGQLPFAPPAQRIALRQRTDALPATAQPMLAWGNGRSYGDVCVNSGGTVLETRGLDRFIAFDETTGILRAEAGLLLDELIRVLLPRGWFLPVTPGTRFVTLGGALANDVHGKNHHQAGTFGCHVRFVELLRSDSGRRLCSPEQNADLYAATIGGLPWPGDLGRVLQRIPCPAWRHQSALPWVG